MGRKPQDWRGFTGFNAWFRDKAPQHLNRELVLMIAERWKVTVGLGAVDNLRRHLSARMSPATRRRSLDERPKDVTPRPVVERARQTPDATGLTPEEKLDRDILRRQLEKLSARQTLYEVIGEKFVQSVKTIPALPPVRPPQIKIPRDLSEEEAVLMISDVQAGLVLGVRDSGGLGEFNSKILIEQAAFLTETVIGLMRYHPNIRTLHIFLGGDIVDGETIFPGHSRQIDLNSVQQVMLCVEHLGRMIWKLSHVFVRIIVHCVIGNHGRIGRKDEQDPMSNLDYLTYKWLEERLRPAKNVEWDIPDTWWTLVPIQGYNFLLVHGDDVGGGYAGIPFYGAGRNKARYQDMLNVSGRMLGRSIPIVNYMCIGHFSEPADFYSCIMNGSWPGGTAFSVKRLQRNAIPSQKFWGVHKRYGLTWMRDLVLRPMP